MSQRLKPSELSNLNIRVQDMLKTHKTYRAGQALFNALHEIRPDLANLVRGTQNDCFYKNDNIKNFFKAICSDEAYENIHQRYKN